MSTRARPEVPAEPVSVAADGMQSQLRKAASGQAEPLPRSVREALRPALAHRFGSIAVGRDVSRETLGPRQSLAGVQSAETQARAVAEETTSKPRRPDVDAQAPDPLDSMRVHRSGAVDRVTRSLGARALTFGSHIMVRGDQWKPGSASTRSLLAHEATHVMQQSRDGLGVHADLESPDRYKELNTEIFSKTPGGGTPQKWQDAKDPNRGTAGVIFDSFVQHLKDLIAKNPMSIGGDVPTLTTAGEAKTEAVTVDAALHARYPFMPTATESELEGAVALQSQAQTQADDYRRQWLINQLYLHTTLGDFAIDDTDARVQKILTDLLNDSYAGPKIRILATRSGAFTTGEGRGRQVFLNKGLNAKQLETVLFHELVHFYVSPDFKRWIDGSNASREYEEGFTEFLARNAQTPVPTQGSYEQSFQAITTRVASRAPLFDIARAYFLGETWRLETRSAVSRELFATQVGIKASATPREERAQSLTAKGVFETVEPGAHYRFMSFGNDEATLKTEHSQALRDVIRQFVTGHADVRVRFIGHTSSPGTEQHNEKLSEQRSQAFYDAALSEGVPAGQLLDADKPPHFGEKRPTATEEDPITRAFNRRVEMFLTTAGKGAPAPGAQEEAADAE